MLYFGFAESGSHKYRVAIGLGRGGHFEYWLLALTSCQHRCKLRELAMLRVM
jgi:hypothetical protein